MDAHGNQQQAADGVDKGVMTLDGVKRRLERVDKHGAHHKRNAESCRVRQEHEHPLQRMRLLRG